MWQLSARGRKGQKKIHLKRITCKKSTETTALPQDHQHLEQLVIALRLPPPPPRPPQHPLTAQTCTGNMTLLLHQSLPQTNRPKALCFFFSLSLFSFFLSVFFFFFFLLFFPATHQSDRMVNSLKVVTCMKQTFEMAMICCCC